jgi:hypothetical protein
MSMNIDTSDILSSEGFAIPRTLWRALALPAGGEVVDAPEDSFLNPNWPQSGDVEDIHGILFVKRFPWRGEGSGYSWDLLLQLLVHFLGSADLVVTWEGGNGQTGIRVLNGKVTRHKVVLALGEVTP